MADGGRSAEGAYRLYAAPLSLYSGKARGCPIIPVLVLPDT